MMLHKIGSKLALLFPWAEHDEQPRAAALPRSEKRSRISRLARVYFADFKRRALVRDVSRRGMMIETMLPPAVGECVTVKIEGLEPIAGHVRWRKGGRAGVRFERPLTQQEIAGCASVEEQDAALFPLNRHA